MRLGVVAYDKHPIMTWSRLCSLLMRQPCCHAFPRCGIIDPALRGGKDTFAASPREMRRRKRLEKMKAVGATTVLAYRLGNLRRRCRALSMELAPRTLLARARRKRFEHIISLGANCEVAFRFYCRWKFVDSSLFSWAIVANTIQLAQVLRSLDDFCSGALALNSVRMWVCGNTGVRIHGRMKYIPGTPPPDAETEASDKADLLGRVTHLRDKLRRYAADEKSTLFIYRIPTNDVKTPGLTERLNEVENALRELGARNWKLLLIAERCAARLIPPGPNRYIRSVRKFNPTNDVTSAERGDPVGWHAIFTEFAPVHILKKTKKFKFEH